MAIPKCPKGDCTSTVFSVSEFEPSGSRFRLMAVHCSRCGAVVGVMDFFNIGAQVNKIGEKLGLDMR